MRMLCLVDCNYVWCEFTLLVLVYTYTFLVFTRDSAWFNRRFKHYFTCLIKSHLISYFQIIISGDVDGEDTKQLQQCVNSNYIPNKVVIIHDGKEGFLTSKLTVLKNMERIDGKATAYVCENFTCKQPVNTVEDLTKLLTAEKA